MPADVIKRRSESKIQRKWFRDFNRHRSKQIKQPLGWVEQVSVYYCDPFDQWVATPLANFNVCEETFGCNIFQAINSSRYAPIWHGALFGIGFLALLIGHIVASYRILRLQEKGSHFFYFRRLLQSEQSSEIKKAMGESEINFDILSAAAYFYSPGISRLACWKRRVFCWGKRRKEYADLKGYLTKKRLEGQQTEKQILNDIFVETINKLVKFLNQNSAVNNLPERFQQKKENPYLISFSEEYSKIFFPGKIVFPDKSKKNVNLGQSILGAIGEASFFYWLCMFVFYFAPPVGVVAGLSFPPLALAVSFLAIRCVYIIYSFKKDSVNEQIHLLNNKETDVLMEEILKRKYESDDIELKKQAIFIGIKETSIGGLRDFKGSKLQKDLWKVLSHRRFMKAAAMVDAFIGGCFLPFFGIWLFNDLFKVVAGLAIGGTVIGPAAPAAFAVVFMVIAIVTLALGVGYGVKKAIKTGKEQDEKYRKLESEVKALEQPSSDAKQIQILDLRLHEYDRFFRRYSLEQPVWTQVKKFLNRFWVVVRRLGTGSLLFRLVIWASITAFIAVPAALIAPILLPFTATFALLAAIGYVCYYHVDQKWKRAENITSYFYSSEMLNEKEKDLNRKDPLDEKEEPRPELFVSATLHPLSKSKMSPNNENRGNLDKKTTDPKSFGGTSPDSIKSNVSFDNTSISELLKRAKSTSLSQLFDTPNSENSLEHSSVLSSNSMVHCRC